MTVLVSIEVNFALLNQTHMMINFQTTRLKMMERETERTK